MALFRTVAKDGVSIPFVFQSSQSAATTPLVSLDFRNRDEDSAVVYRMASVDVYDSAAAAGRPSLDGFGAVAISTASNGVLSEVARFTDENFLGVNTPLPRANLHVRGTAILEGGRVALSNATLDLEDTDLLLRGGSLLAPGPAGAPGVLVTPDGRLAVGTDSPDPRYALVVSGDVLVDGALVSTRDPPADLPFLTFDDDRLALRTGSNDRFVIQPDGRAALSSDLSVAGDAALSSTLAVAGDAALSSTLAVAGDAALSSALSVAGDASLSSTLAVAGDAALSSSLSVAGDASLASALSVAGDAALSSDLAVAGDASLASALSVAGDAALSSALSVAGDASLSSALSVAGDASLASALAVAGDASLASDLAVAGDATVGGRVLVGGIALPGGAPGQVVASAGAASLAYTHPHTDTLAPPLPVLVAGPSADHPLEDNPSDAPAFAFVPVVDPRGFSVPGDRALRLPAAPGVRLLLILAVSTSRPGRDEQTTETALLAGGAAPVHTCHSINNATNDLHTGFAAAVVEAGSPDVSVRSRRLLGPADGGVSLASATRVLGLRLESPGFSASSSGPPAALPPDLGPAAPLAPRFSDGAAFAPGPGGFVATAAQTVLVLAGASTAGDGDRMRAALSLNGSLGPASHTPASDGRASVSLARVLSLAQGDAVQLSCAAAAGEGASLAAASLSAAAFPAADAAQLDLADAAPPPVAAGSFYQVPLPSAGALGASFSLGGSGLVLEQEGFLVVLATVTVEGDGAASGRAGVSARLLLDGFTTLKTGGCLLDRAGRATVSLVAAAELPAGSSLGLDLVSNRGFAVSAASLCAVRVDNSYPPDPTLLTYGGYYKRAVLGADFQNDSTGFQDALVLLTGSVPEGVYRVSFQGRLRRLANRTAEYRLLVDGARAVGACLARVAPPNGNEATAAHSELLFLAAGRHAVALQHRSTVNNATALVAAGASIEVHRVR